MTSGTSQGDPKETQEYEAKMEGKVKIGLKVSFTISVFTTDIFSLGLFIGL